MAIHSLSITNILKTRIHEDWTYTYVWRAEEGSGTDSPAWNISRITDNDFSINHPDGNWAFKFIWDNHESYDYN